MDHRGPDSSGIHVDGAVGLAHTRLSLVDLNERSRQPFWDTARRYCLVYNGEIYNFKELRRDLEQRGVNFETTSDTEVLLHCLIQGGADITLPRLEGMFAFALYDSQNKSLLLARDRFGIKPLYVYEDDQVLLFSSEIKAMRPWVTLTENPFSITSYLLGTSGPAQNACFYKNVRILPPSTVIKMDVGGSPEFSQFTRLTDMLDGDLAEDLKRLKPEQMVDRVDELVQKSVNNMLVADAPVGALCSGGVDSSLLMAVAARSHNNLAVFHADIVGPLSEYDAARKLADHLKLDLKKVEVRDQDFIDLMPEVIRHYEHPYFKHKHSVPFMMVSKLVHQNEVKAVLTGEGSDECFLGYGHLAMVQPFLEMYFRQVERMARLVRKIPVAGGLMWPSHDSKNLMTDMLSQFERSQEEGFVRQRYAEFPNLPNNRNVMTLEMLSYHLRTLLHRNDTMGMSASLEARFPFLSEALVKTAINLPYNAKIRFSPSVLEKNHPFMRDKWILRKVADRYMPKILSQRKKLPFNVNAYERIKIPASYFRNSYFSEYSGLTGTDLDYLLDRLDQTLRVKLLMLDVWGRVCIRGEDAHHVSDSLRAQLSF